MNVLIRLKSYRDYLIQQNLKRRLLNHNFTIISNNCWGGEVYKYFNLPYQTPFIGLFLFAPCYLHLLENLQENLQAKLSFTQDSRYALANEFRSKGIWSHYPIGLIQDEIEIHFMHYSSEEEAQDKWYRRLQRIHWQHSDRFFFKFCDHGLCDTQLLQVFDRLHFKNKVCFTSQFYPDLRSAVWIKECRTQRSVVDGGRLYPVCHKYFDVVAWLNRGIEVD